MIYITGDIHGGIDIRCLNRKNFPEAKKLTRNDFLIITGDFGLPWANDREDKYWLNWLSRQTYTTLFIDGNHENFDLLNVFPETEWNGGRVHILRESVLHLLRGQVYTINGVKVFTFGGAASHDRQYRKEHKSWWKDELPNQKEYDEGLRNLSEHNWQVDLVITHTAPRKYIEGLLSRPYIEDNETILHNYLEDIASKLHFKKWFFGHFHKDAEIDEKFTVIYNRVLLFS